MEDLKIGQLIEGNKQRDAIHVAVMPVIATDRLEPGERISIHENYKAQYESRSGDIGIVDPFLKKAVYPGEKFWMFLVPGSITSLRHDWTHPAFGGKEPSFAWMNRFTADMCLSTQELIEQVTNALKTGDAVYVGDYEDGIPNEFWDHYQIITGQVIPEYDRNIYFKCAC